MQQIVLPKWFFCCSTIVLQIYVLHASELQNQEAIEKVTMETIDWPGLLTNLRDSWQSPLSYLQKRGYLPPGNEKLLEQKLNELRGMCANELRNDENLKMETNGDVYASAGSRANELLHPSDLSSAETDTLSSDGVIATYASQEPQGAIDNFLKEFSLDAQPDSDTETDLEFDGDVESFKNNKANACGKKPHTGGVKSNSKHKCKLKSKSKTKSQPGFFKRIKQKLSSIFTNSKSVDSKTDAIKKPCLTPDYANYFVKYLANKDLKGQYAGVKKYGEKGVHRRDQSGKDLSQQDLTFQSTNLKDDTAHVKDFSLNSFPFKDFNLGDLNLKNVQTKGTRSQSNDDNKLSDLKNFNSQDEELNKIVHSLAEQQSPAKDLPDTKIEKWEPKDDFNLKEFSLTKDAPNKLHDNSNSLQKEFATNFEGKNIDNAEKNDEAASAVNDLTLPHTKNSDISIEDNWSKGANLNDFDFSLPDLNLKNLTSTAKDIASKDAGVKDFGNLGMSSIKMKILESIAEEAAANADIEHISHQPLMYGFDTKSADSDAKDELTNEGNSNDYGARLLDTYKMNSKNFNGDASHAGVKEADVKNFDFGSLTANNRNYLDLDRQFTRQVVENIIRKERRGYGHNDKPDKE